MNQSNWGSTLDEFLKEEGIYDTAKTTAIMRVIAWQLTEEMNKQGINKTELAERVHTSQIQVERVLKGKSNVTIATLQKVAALIGRELRFELI